MNKAIVPIPNEPEWLSTFIVNGVRLPKGYQPDIRGLSNDYRMDCLLLVVRGIDIPPTEPGVELPRLDKVLDDGIIHIVPWSQTHD